MNTTQPTLGRIVWKTVVVHTVTYFLLGVISYLAFDYPAKFSDPRYSGVIRPLDHPLVMAGPLFQPLRGLVFALVFFPLREVVFRQPRGWLVLWWSLLALGILNTFGPAPCSIEGMIYSPLPFLDHITGLPETVIQSLAFAVLLFYWVHHPDTKWLNWLLHIAFAIVISLPILGLLASSRLFGAMSSQ
jgi:hypothetical protein